MPQSPSLVTAPDAMGKHHLIATLGSGGMADVFLAVVRGPARFRKLVVVKRLRSALAEDLAALAMFLDEARLAARLNHPNVVQTLEVGSDGTTYYIVMEFLDGQPLHRIVKAADRSPFEPAFYACVVAQALSGLHYVHEARDYDGRPLHVVHRDVSPHNIFVTYDGVAKLVDFGIAKAASSSSQTEVGVLKGKLAYMAPEQAMGAPVDRRADIFAMGIVLWEMLARRPLIAGSSAAEKLNQLLYGRIPRISEVVRGVDPVLDRVLTCALERDPNRRFQSAAQMAHALHGYLSEHPFTHDAAAGRMRALFEASRRELARQIRCCMDADPQVASEGGRAYGADASPAGGHGAVGAMHIALPARQ